MLCGLSPRLSLIPTVLLVTILSEYLLQLLLEMLVQKLLYLLKVRVLCIKQLTYVHAAW